MTILQGGRDKDVPREHTNRYGIVSAEPVTDTLARLRGVVEKPKPEAAPSTLAIVGRYVLDSRIFELLETTGKGSGGEIQLTDAIATLLREKPVYSYRFTGRRFDCGNRLGMVQATVHLALEDPELHAPVVELMRERLARE